MPTLILDEPTARKKPTLVLDEPVSKPKLVLDESQPLPLLTGADVPESYRRMGVKQWRPSTDQDPDYLEYLVRKQNQQNPPVFPRGTPQPAKEPVYQDGIEFNPALAGKSPGFDPSVAPRDKMGIEARDEPTLNTYADKVNLWKKSLSQADATTQARILSVSKLGNPFNIASWLSNKGITPDEKNVSAFHDAVTQFESELKLSDPRKWAGIAGSIGKVASEFALVPGAGNGIAGTAGKFATQELMTLPTTEQSQLGTGEYLKQKTESALKQGLTGAGVGTAGKYIKNPLYRVPTVTGGFMGLTALEGGTRDQILESGITILGFEALGLAQKGLYREAAVKAKEENPKLKQVADLEKVIKQIVPTDRAPDKLPVLGQQGINPAGQATETPRKPTLIPDTEQNAPQGKPEALKAKALAADGGEPMDTAISAKAVADTATQEPMTRQEWQDLFKSKKLSEKDIRSLMKERLSDIEYQMYTEDRNSARSRNEEAAGRAFDTEFTILHNEYGYQYNKVKHTWERLPNKAIEYINSGTTYEDYLKQFSKPADLLQSSPSATIPPMAENEAARDIAPEQTAEAGGGVRKIDPSNAVMFDGTLYHNTDYENAHTILEKGFIVEDTSKLSSAERGFVAGNLGDGVYLSPDFATNAGNWGGEANLVVRPKKPLKLYNLGNEEGSASINISLADELKKQGYDGIIVNDPNPKSGGYQVVIFDPKKIKAKQIVEQSDISPEELAKINVKLSSFNLPAPQAGGEKTDLTGQKLRPELQGGASGEQKQAWAPEDFKTVKAAGEINAKADIEGQDTMFGEAKKNKVFTEERYKKAKENFYKQGELFAGLDPNKFKNIIEIGGYHFEKGLREFGTWSKAMITEFGEKIKPHLQKIWDRLESSFDVDRISRAEHLKKIEDEIVSHDLYKEAGSKSQYLTGGLYRVGKTEAGEVKHFLESHPELKKNIITEEEYRQNPDKYPGATPWDTALAEAGSSENRPDLEHGGIDMFLETLAERTELTKGGKGRVNERQLEKALEKGEGGFEFTAQIRSWLKEGLEIDDVNKNIAEMGEAMGMDADSVKAWQLEKATESPKPPRKELKTKAEKELQKLIEIEYASEAKKEAPYKRNIETAIKEIDRLVKVIGDSKELVYEPQRKKIKLLEREVAKQQKKIETVKTKSKEHIAKIRSQVQARIKGRLQTAKKNIEAKYQEEQKHLRLRLDRIKEALSQRTITPWQAKASIKEIMKKLPMDTRPEIKETTDPAEYIKLIEEIKQQVKAKPLREPRAEEVDRIDYDNLKAEKTGISDQLQKAGSKTQDTVKYYGESLSSRIKVIAPKIAARVRKLIQERDIAKNEDHEGISDWVKGFQKLTADEKFKLSIALGNKNKGVANEIIDKYGLRDAYDNMQATKEKIHQELLDAGIEIGSIEDHYPRYIKDFKKYQEDYDRYWANQVKAKESKLGRKLTEDEESQLANSLLTTRRFGISTTPGSAKHREFEYIPPELAKHYALADETIDRYINDAREKIFRAKLLGKEPESVQRVRKQLSTLYTRFAKMADDDPSKLKTGRQIIKIQEWLETKKPDLIGKFAVDAIKAGELKSKDTIELQKAMNALFEPDNPRGAGLSNAISMDTLNMLSTALSQAQGQPAAFARHPGIYTKTITGILKRSLSKALGSEDPIFRYTLGEVAQKEMTRDLYEGNKWRKAKKVLMFAIAKFDKLDANVDLEQFYNEFQSAAKKGKANADTEYLKKIFDGEEYQRVLGDFRDGIKTPLTRLAIYNRLADVRLLSKFEQPEGFTRAGTAGKLFYKFKTAQTKMINWYYEESIRNIQSKNPVLVKEGYKNLVRIPVAMLAANIAVNTVQDWLKGKKIDMSEITIDSALQMLPIVNRFSINQFRQFGIKGFIASMIPTGRTPEAVARAIKSGQPEQLLKAVPWVGDILYNKTDVAKKNAARYSNEKTDGRQREDRPTR